MRILRNIEKLVFNELRYFNTLLADSFFALRNIYCGVFPHIFIYLFYLILHITISNFRLNE